MSDTNQLVKIEWRLLQMMAERRIKKNTDMAHRLRQLGIEISTHQVGRLVEQFPERLNTEYLRGFLTVLECDISDLIRVHPADADVIEGRNSAIPVPKAKSAKVEPKTPRAKPQAVPDKPLQSAAMPDGIDGYFKDE